jgi:phosphoribosylformimino-5-aminoimidazole carboxamide ribotide isomerase
MTMSFNVIPAIDVRNGCVVRLSQGDFARETVYEDSPLAAAHRYADAGAQWLHLVDLDAAKNGSYSLQALLGNLRRSTRLQIQTGGGIRSGADVEALLDLGVARVVVGTLAVREPLRVGNWIRDYGSERITLALDTKQDEVTGTWHLPTAGWTENSAKTLDGLLSFYARAGLKHLLCTDIARDGMLGGFNLDLYRTLSKSWPQLAIQASGGVRSVDDVIAAREAGAGAAILGRALLEARFTLAEALAC